MSKKAKKEPQLTRDAWLELALQVLRAEGIQGVRIERLARDLGVTKGSFYWHFENRDDLWHSMLDYWCESYNDVVMKSRAILEDEPSHGLKIVIQKVRQEKLDQYELAMRSWADHDQAAAQVVEEVYAQRKKFIRSFFTRLGFRGRDADARTRLALCYLSWEPSMSFDLPDKSQAELAESIHRILTTS